jgi:Phosphotransferase enzyme family
VTPLDAAVNVARRNGLRVEQPVILSNGANLVVHLSPAPVVARVATLTAITRPRIEQAFAREIGLAAHLHDQGVPTVPPSAEMPPGPHVEAGHVISFWRHISPPTEPPELDGAGFGRMLRELHQVLRGYAGPIEPLGPSGPPLADIAVYLTQVGNGERPLSMLTEDDVIAVRSMLDELPRFDADDAQPLHGDASPGNLIASSDGWLWSDFEEACRGPVAWDLASFSRTRAFDPEVAWATYGDVNRAALAPFLRLRGLHALVWWLMYAERDSAADRRARARQAAADRLEAWRAGR